MAALARRTGQIGPIVEHGRRPLACLCGHGHDGGCQREGQEWQLLQEQPDERNARGSLVDPRTRPTAPCSRFLAPARTRKRVPRVPRSLPAPCLNGQKSSKQEHGRQGDEHRLGHQPQGHARKTRSQRPKPGEAA